MVSRHALLYRSILGEIRKSAVVSKKNKDVITHLRLIVEKCRTPGNEQAIRDLENTLVYLRSQREHKVLLHRYNPLIDLTSEERVKATANRVGLDMPKPPRLDS